MNGFYIFAIHLSDSENKQSFIYIYILIKISIALVVHSNGPFGFTILKSVINNNNFKICDFKM
jgi:hypothetical protein